MMVVEKARSVPVADEADVFVAGGGIAGVAAALAAARSGKRVILAEKFCELGGLATVGLVVLYLALCDGYGRQMIGGIGEELLLLAHESGISGKTFAEVSFPTEIPACWSAPALREERVKSRYEIAYDAAPMMLALETLLLDHGVSLWYDTRICGVIMQNGNISHVVVENKSGRLAIASKTVIDCTGDADVCHMSGERTYSSDQNRRSCWYFGANSVTGKLQRHSLSDPMYGAPPPDSRWYRGDIGKEVSSYLIDMHAFIRTKNEEYNARHQTAEIPFLISQMPLFRMSRRLVSRQDITASDIGVWKDDCVGMTGDWRKPALGYCITLSSLRGERVGNLFAAGRCMGAAGDTWDVMRVIPTCAVTGEAAGIAAAELACSSAATQELSAARIAEIIKERGGIISSELLQPC